MTSENSNVKLVRSLFAKIGSDDTPITFDGYLSGGWDMLFAPDITYCGTSVRGQLQMAHGKEALFEMSREPQEHMEPDERGEELLECVPFGDEMVAAHVRCHRRLRNTGQSVSYEYVMLVRIENGVITRGVDIGERKIDEIYQTLNGDSTASPVPATTVNSCRDHGTSREENA